MSSGKQEEIARRHYATDESYRVQQQIHDEYTVPSRSFPEWVLERVDVQPGARLLDVGCGPGPYFQKLRDTVQDIHYVGLDLVPAMLQHHPAMQDETPLMVADAQVLPFADHSFDVVMANQMLYHVEDVELAIHEMHRVLKPGGLLLTATDSAGTMPELQVLMRRAIVLLTRSGATTVRAPELPNARFSLENGTRLLSRQFYAIVRHDLTSSLVFPDVEPAMDYLESVRDLREGNLPDDVVWEDVMMIMRQQINQLIKHLGELVITKHSGLLIASDDGGFIGEFIARMKESVTRE